MSEDRYEKDYDEVDRIRELEYSWRPSIFRKPGLFFGAIILISGGIYTHYMMDISWDPEILGVIKDYVSLGLLGWGVFNVLQMIYNKYKVLYILNMNEMRERVGILSRDANSIAPQEITNINVKQTLSEKIFNIGRIDIASSGTDEAEITMTGIKSPVKVREQIQQMKNACQKYIG
jgi:uncharacterized membrane protein YdbT with pleckstrin-like domain